MLIQDLRQFTKRKWREKRDGEEGERGKRGEGRKGEQHNHNCAKEREDSRDEQGRPLTMI